MSGADRARVEAVFEEALERAPEQRHAFVVQACGDDAAVRAAVLALLAAHGRERGVLDSAADALLVREQPPDRLGAYRVIREIGRGGMGVVYDAERDDGQFRRRVAIKILRTGIDDALGIRVRTERQILAALDHPHIARLLDGGVTPDGRPYLVMEHVDGLPVSVYCERMRLSVAERLRLFLVIARAVDFAHRNLIVHRDLKPSNILVTPDGQVKLLDFGVAKLLNPSLLGTAAPRTGEQLALTPEYASPEQLRNETLTTTTDVFSLGVVLYELLTGRRPYSRHEVSLPSLATATGREEAERPSVRVLQRETVTTGRGERVLEPDAVAAERQSTPARLARALRGDIDAIVAVALRAEPLRRYGSAELLAQDIERHLQHRRVHAHLGSRAHALRKLVRRHRVQAAAAALALGAVLLGAGASLSQAAAARRERARAEEARAQSEQVTAFLLDMFDAADQPAVAVTARDLVRRGSARIDQLAAQPVVQARVLGALGRIHESLGEYEEGQNATQRALAAMTAERGADDAETAGLLVQLGILQRQRGEYDSAQAAFVRARDIQQRVLGAGSPELGHTLHQLARVAVYRGEFGEAENRARAAYEMQRAALGADHRLTLNTLTLLGRIQRSRGDRAGAEQSLRHALELRSRSSEPRRAELLNDRFELADLLIGDSTGIVEAESMLRATLPSLDEDDPEDVPFIVWGQSSLAEILNRRGDFAASEQLHRQTIALRTRVYGAEHPTTGESLQALGRTLLSAGDAATAEPPLRAAAGVFQRALGERHPMYAAALMDLSRALLDRNALPEADSLSTLAAAIRAERYGRQSHGYAQALRLRAEVQIRLGAYAFAETLLREALEQTTARPGGAVSAEARAIHALYARLYTAWGRPADAARHRTLAAQ